MNFNELDADMGVALFRELGELITYRRATGETISGIYAQIDQDLEQFGDTQSGVGEYRNEAALLRADVGEPCRGDAVITADGTTFVIQDRVPGGCDKVEVRYTIK